MSITAGNIGKLQREFKMLIERCGCSRASLEITPEEAKKMNDEKLGGYTKIEPVEPHCTPKKCFPTLYALLYPYGGFSQVCYHVQSYRRGKKNAKTK